MEMFEVQISKVTLVPTSPPHMCRVFLLNRKIKTARTCKKTKRIIIIKGKCARKAKKMSSARKRWVCESVGVEVTHRRRPLVLPKDSCLAVTGSGGNTTASASVRK